MRRRWEKLLLKAGAVDMWVELEGSRVPEFLGSGIKNSLFCELVVCKKGSFSNLELRWNVSLNSVWTKMIPLVECFDAGFTA